MKLKTNAFLQAIRAGKPQIGLWATLAAPNATDAIADAGFDWVVIDTEHSPNDLPLVVQHLRCFTGTDTTPIVRPDWNDPVKVKGILDAGAPGLVFPMIQSADEARAAVAATRYPPHGLRGVSGVTHANRFGRTTDYFQRIHDETAVIAQAETRAALAQVTEIAAVEGVDGVFFGPADIAADMGLLGQTMHDDVWAAIKEAAAPLIAKGMPVGTLVSDAGFARHLLAEGFTFVACGTDAGLLARSADQLVATVRNG